MNAEHSGESSSDVRHASWKIREEAACGLPPSLDGEGCASKPEVDTSLEKAIPPVSVGPLINESHARF